ncbi:unnamed protein product, partial [Brassica oleracea var. botrytis]
MVVIVYIVCKASEVFMYTLRFLLVSKGHKAYEQNQKLIT